MIRLVMRNHSLGVSKEKPLNLGLTNVEYSTCDVLSHFVLTLST